MKFFQAEPYFTIHHQPDILGLEKLSQILIYQPFTATFDWNDGRALMSAS